MTNHKPAITNPVMGQSAPFTQHQQAGNRHPANRHRHTPKKPRYAHKVQQQGKDTSQASTAPKTAQNSTNTGANKAGFGIGGNHNQPSRQHPAKSHPKQRQRADLARLPSPIDFYHTYGLTLKGSGVWRMAVCPFHDDRHPSLSINTDHGGYICHVCGASGDMVGFYMARFGVDFVQACKELDLYR